MDRAEALAELTRRYFTSHGPATVKDFQWWSSLSAPDVRLGLEAVGDGLGREVMGGIATGQQIRRKIARRRKAGCSQVAGCWRPTRPGRR